MDMPPWPVAPLTMNLDELQARIRRRRRNHDVDVNAWFEQYRQTGREDMDGFLQFLLEQGQIDKPMFATLHGSHRVDVQPRDLEAARTMAVAPAGATAAGPFTPGSAEPVAVSATSDSYEVLGTLGEGAMGQVHVARDAMLRRKVALKSILPDMQRNDQMFSRFVTEMQITSQLDHPFIVPVYGVAGGPSGGLAYAMKLVQGRELEELLEETRAMLDAGQPLDAEHSLEARLDVFLKVCDAIAYAHDKGIVHRDLKPANVMLGTFNEVYVMDWGIARPMGEGGKACDSGVELYAGRGDGQDHKRTLLGMALGTPIYMSPEQAQGRNDELDGRSDLYALGLILQELITLEVAMAGETVQEAFTAAKEGRREPPKPHPAAGPVPRELVAIIDKATQRDPSKRYPTVQALADDVRRYQRNEEILAAPDTAFQKLGRWISKNRTKTLAIMGALMLVGAAVAIGQLLYNRRVQAQNHAREMRSAAFQTQSAMKAHAVDQQLKRYEAALAQLVGATQVVLRHPAPSADEVYFASDFAGEGTAPPELAPSDRYGTKVSFSAPVFTLAEGSTREDAGASLARLSFLVGPMREALLRSAGRPPAGLSPAGEEQLLRQLSIPIRDVVVALDDGVHLVFPGRAPFPPRYLPGGDDYDALPTGAEIQWSKPMPNDVGTMVLRCSASVFSGANERLGGVAFEIPLTSLVAEPDEAAAEGEYREVTLLVNRDGKVMAEERREGATVVAADGDQLAFPEVAGAIKEGKSGFTEVEKDGKRYLVTYHPVDTLDWYYVGVASVDSMLEEPDADDERAVAVPRREATAPPPVASAPAASPPPPPAASASASASASAEPPPPPPPPVWRRPPPAPDPNKPPPPPPNPFDKWKAYEKKTPGGSK